MVPAMTDVDDRPGLAALLAWYRDMGVDCALSDEPENWLARPGRPPGAGWSLSAGTATGDVAEAPALAAVANRPPAVPASPAPARASLIGRPLPATAPAPRLPQATPPDAAETAARTAARAAATIDELGAALAAFTGCALKATAKSLCFYRGAPKARVMLIGEAPGREEDLAGRPFVGPAGQLLDRMLAAIGLDESMVHITNIVYWRPPGNRTPTPQEAQACRPFLERQVELVAPDVIIPLGGAAAKHVLDVTEGIMRIRGQWSEVTFGAHRSRAMPMLHPAYLLRTPAGKRQAWRDLLTLRAALSV